MTESERPSDRRIHDRYPVTWAVDCQTEETFLYAFITNISELGIFVKTTEPLALGTELALSFAPPGKEPFKLRGAVAWINPARIGDSNPGMGIRFLDLTLEERERIVDVVKTVAYVRAPQKN